MRKIAIPQNILNMLMKDKSLILGGMSGEGRSEIYDAIVKEYGPYLVLSDRELRNANDPNKLHIMKLIKGKLSDRFSPDAINQVLSMIFRFLTTQAASGAPSTAQYHSRIVKGAKKVLDKSNKIV